jgi:Fe-S-cluster containining protein
VVHWRTPRTKRRAVIADAPVDDDPRCRSCEAACCRSFVSVPITWTEFERLRALGAQRLELSLHGAHRLIIDGACEFLEGGRCAIYQERPELCRRFICIEP